MVRFVVVDNDCGVDDAWALNFILNSTNNDVQILGIICVSGNTSVDNVCKNNLYFLKVANHPEIPVFKGAESQLVPPDNSSLDDDLEYFHGKNGFGDVPLPELPDMPKAQKENGIVALNRIVSEKKDQVTVICCGPLTNIALAIKTYKNFKEDVKAIYIMGGSYTGKGNTTMSAEFNFHKDPEAAHIVLSEMPKMIITLLPWETCLLAGIPFKWREELGSEGGEVMSLLNQIEKPILERSRRLGSKVWISADQLLAALFIKTDLILETENMHATVELAGKYTRGQVVIDHLGSREHNIRIIKKLDVKLYKDMLLRLKTF